MRFQSEKYPAEHKEEVLRLYYNYEKESLRDNYMDYVHREKVEEKFKEIFDGLYESESYELRMKTSRVPYPKYEYKATESVEEFLNHSPDSNIRVYVERVSVWNRWKYILCNTGTTNQHKRNRSSEAISRVQI